jgi:hypothetical protein
VEHLDTPGGHILVALFIFATGIGLLLHGNDIGKEITVGALASLWTALRIGGNGVNTGTTTGANADSQRRS